MNERQTVSRAGPEPPGPSGPNRPNRPSGPNRPVGSVGSVGSGEADRSARGGPQEGGRGPGWEERFGRLRVAVRRIGAVRIVTVAGELDRDSVAGPRAALAVPEREAGVERIVVDLAGVTFCDSTGLNMLLRARLDALTAGLRLDVAGLRPAVARLFEITGADAVLRVHPDVAAALADDGGPVPGGAGAR